MFGCRVGPQGDMGAHSAHIGFIAHATLAFISETGSSILGEIHKSENEVRPMKLEKIHVLSYAAMQTALVFAASATTCALASRPYN